MFKLKIVSINARGLADRLKRREVFSYLRRKGDIICIQETHCTNETQNIWRNEWGGEIIFANGTGKAKGVCILAKKGVSFQNVIKDINGRYIAANIIMGENSIGLCNIYAPNTDDPNFFLRSPKF